VYLVEGFKYKLNLQSEITRHAKHAREAFSIHSRWFSVSSLIERTCLEIQRNSIWFNTATLGSSIGELCKKLVENDKIDLLPSQQQALGLSVLDPASSATIVQMPTSAGKTLLAEFSILQMKALYKDAKIVYLVPTRALVNQVVSDLRSDFEGLGLSIERTSKVNEVDPLEEKLLKEEIDILVSTPEKFDLLIRKKTFFG
jgi:replicative superfamily II helicase